MRQTTTVSVLAALAAAVALGVSSPAYAHKLDPDMSGFIECSDDGRVCRPMVSEYETFLAEYSFGFAPKLLAPAETLGYSGFYMGLEGTLTPRPGTKGSAHRWDIATAASGYEDVMFVPTIHLRKGLPWSFEIGGTLSYLARSELLAIGAELKWSLFEGYRHGFRGALPDVAVRGTVSRIVGSPDLDMTLTGVDASISRAFGVGGMVALTPYLGYQYLWTFSRVEPLIKYQNGRYHREVEGRWATNGLTGPNLGRHKLFAGLRFTYEAFEMTAEVGWGLKSHWKTDAERDSYESYFDSRNMSQREQDAFFDDERKASVGHQVQVTIGVGADF